MLARIRSRCFEYLHRATEKSPSKDIQFVGISPHTAGVLTGIINPAATGIAGRVAFCQNGDQWTRPTSTAALAAPRAASSTATTTKMPPRRMVPLLSNLQTPISALLVFMRLPKMLENHLDGLFSLSGAPPPCVRNNMGRPLKSIPKDLLEQPAVDLSQERERAHPLQSGFFAVELNPPSTVKGWVEGLAQNLFDVYFHRSLDILEELVVSFHCRCYPWTFRRSRFMTHAPIDKTDLECEKNHLKERLEETRAGIGFSTLHFHKSRYHRTALVSQAIIHCLELSWEPNSSAPTEGTELQALYMHLAAMCNYNIVRVLGAGEQVTATVPHNKTKVMRNKISEICHTLIKQLTTLGSIADGLAQDTPPTMDAGWRHGPLDHRKRPKTYSGYRFYLFDLFRHMSWFRRLITGFFATPSGASSSSEETNASTPSMPGPLVAHIWKPRAERSPDC